MITLRELNLIHYRSHHKTKVEFGPGLNVFAGPVGSGKSSVIMAVTAAILGRNMLTDARGIGLDEQIHDGANGFSIDLSFDSPAGVVQLCRTKKPATPGSGLSFQPLPRGCRTGIREMEAALLNLIHPGLRPDTFAALMDLRPLLQRSAEEQRKEALEVLQPAGEAIAVPPDIAALAAAHLGRGCDLSTITGIDAAHKRLTCPKGDGLLQVARKSRGKQAPAEVVAPDAVYTVVQCDADLKAFRTERDVKVAKLARIEARAEQYEKTAPAELGPEPEAPTDLAKTAAAVRAAEEKVREAWLEIAKTQLLIEENAKKLEAFRSPDGKCPTCGCSFVPGSADEFEQANDELTAVMASRRLAVNAALEKSVEAKSAAHIAQERESAYRLEMSRRERITKEREAWEELGAQLKDEAILAGALRDEIAALDERIARATEYRGTRDAAERAYANYVAELAAYRAADRTVEDLETLEKWLGRDGVRVEAMSRWSAPFLAEMSRVLERFGMGSAALDQENSRFLVGFGSYWRPAANLSEGQQKIFEMAYRIALAKSSGVGLLCVDGASAVHDEEGRLNSLLDCAVDCGLQVLVTVTGEAPYAAGAKVFRFSSDGDRTEVLAA